MAKIKTGELTDAALDWLVAKCMGYVEQGVYGTPEFRDSEVYLRYCDAVLNSCYSPATDWAQAGPIIAREGINLTMFVEGEVDPEDVGSWCAAYDRDNFGDGEKSCIAPTPLIAAMRCFCCSKLGDTVEVPEELM